MPKIEAGTSAGIFLIDGIPYPTTQYVTRYNNKELTATGTEVKVEVIQVSNGQVLSGSTLDLWTDDGDAGFADLQAFVTYIQGFFFEKSGGGGGGLSASTNGLNDNGTTVKFGTALTENTSIPGGTQKNLEIGTSGDLIGSFTSNSLFKTLSTDGALLSRGKTKIDANSGALKIETEPFGGGSTTAVVLSLLANAGKILFKDDTGNFGAYYNADYSALGALDDRWIPDLGHVKAIAGVTTEKLTFSWDDIEEVGSVGFLSVLSVDSFTSANAAGKAIPSTATINSITVNLQGSSSAAAAGNVNIAIQRREAGNALVYTAGSGITITTGSYTIGGVLGSLNDRAERTTGIDASVGGTNPVLYAYVSAIGFATLTSLIVDVEYSY